QIMTKDSRDRLHGGLLLVAGFLLTSLTGFRWAPPPFAWISPIPFLMYARRERTFGKTLGLVGAVIFAYTISTAKIATPPISPFMVPMFSLPIGLVLSFCILVSDGIRRRAGEAWGAAVFAALVALTDWVWLTLTPFGDMMTMGGTLYADLVFCQFASIAGLPGMGLVVAFFQASAASMLAAPGARVSRTLLAASLAVCGAIFAFGAIRLDTRGAGNGMVRVAAIATTVGPCAEGMPSAEVLAAN